MAIVIYTMSYLKRYFHICSYLILPTPCQVQWQVRKQRHKGGPTQKSMPETVSHSSQSRAPPLPHTLMSVLLSKSILHFYRARKPGRTRQRQMKTLAFSLDSNGICNIFHLGLMQYCSTKWKIQQVDNGVWIFLEDTFHKRRREGLQLVNIKITQKHRYLSIYFHLVIDN